MKKTVQTVLGTAAGMAVGAALSWGLMQACTPPMEKALHRRLQGMRSGVHRLTKLMGI